MTCWLFVFHTTISLISTGTIEEYVLQKQLEKVSLANDILLGYLLGDGSIKRSLLAEAVSYKEDTSSVIHDKMVCQKCHPTLRSNAQPEQASILNRYLGDWGHYSTKDSSQRGPLLGVAECDEISFYMHREKWQLPYKIADFLSHFISHTFIQRLQ